MGGAVEQQALIMLSHKQDEQLASLIHSQPSSAIAAHISLDKLAHAGLPKSYVTLLQKSFAEQQTDINEDESPPFALHRLIADTSDKETVFVSEVVAAMQMSGISLNQPNTVQDTPLHLAARSGHVQLCQLLVQHGADPLARNNKNRTPGGQAKLTSDVKGFLTEAECEAKDKRQLQKNNLWDEKMKATQTQSAFGIQCL
ncbi:TPA: hypothetical protein ACH3X2_002461 [Trebouxia sp. C0005]